MILLVLIICVVTPLSALYQLPNYFPRCYQNDPEIHNCISKAGMDLRPYVQKGINELELPSFDPVIFPNLNISTDIVGAQLQATLDNMTFHNMYEYDLSNIEFRPRDVILKGEIKFSHLPLITNYAVDGSLIGMEFKGNGSFDGFLSEVKAIFIITGNIVKIRGVEYCKITDVDIDMDMTELQGKFTGLLTDLGITNDLFNQFSKLIAKVTSPIFAEIFASCVKRYLIRFCKKIPYTHLFPYSPHN